MKLPTLFILPLGKPELISEVFLLGGKVALFADDPQLRVYEAKNGRVVSCTGFVPPGFSEVTQLAPTLEAVRDFAQTQAIR